MNIIILVWGRGGEEYIQVYSHVVGETERTLNELKAKARRGVREIFRFIGLITHSKAPPTKYLPPRNTSHRKGSAIAKHLQPQTATSCSCPLPQNVNNLETSCPTSSIILKAPPLVKAHPPHILVLRCFKRPPHV